MEHHAPDPNWKRYYHIIFGWGRAEPFSKSRTGNMITLFYPEQAVEWNTAAPPAPRRRDRVEVNEPIFIRDVSELCETEHEGRVTKSGGLLCIALQVERFAA